MNASSKGTPRGKFDWHDLTNLSRDVVLCSAATLFVYIADQRFPDHPDEIKYAAFVCCYALAKAGWKFMTDTQIMIKESQT